MLARTAAYTPFRITGAIVAGIAALGWMSERGLGWNNVVGVWVEKVVADAVWIVVGLAVLSVTMALLQHRRKPSPATVGAHALTTALNDQSAQ